MERGSVSHAQRVPLMPICAAHSIVISQQGGSGVGDFFPRLGPPFKALVLRVMNRADD